MFEKKFLNVLTNNILTNQGREYTIVLFFALKVSLYFNSQLNILIQLLNCFKNIIIFAIVHKFKEYNRSENVNNISRNNNKQF